MSQTEKLLAEAQESLRTLREVEVLCLSYQALASWELPCSLPIYQRMLTEVQKEVASLAWEVHDLKVLLLVEQRAASGL